MNRRDFFKLAALSGAATTLGASVLRAKEGEFLAPAPSLQSGDLHFVVFGDWGSGLKLQREVAAAMMAYCRAQKKAKTPVHFAISTGDNFYNDGVLATNDAQWQTKFEQMYAPDAMNFPFYAVLGNHDWRDNPTAQISYALQSRRWRMDGFYYQVSAPNNFADFFFFDTDLWLPQYGSPNLAKKQTAWLQSALQNSRAKWKLAIGHHPPFTDGVYGGSKDPEIVREILVPLLEQYGVHALFSGHDHDLQHIQIEGKKTHFVVSGAAGASLRPKLSDNYGPFHQDLTGGFLAVKLGEKLSATFYDKDGKTLHSWTQSV